MNQFEYEATLRDYKEEGREEGRAEGREEASVQIARAMKAKGISEEIIKEITGVTSAKL